MKGSPELFCLLPILSHPGFSRDVVCVFLAYLLLACLLSSLLFRYIRLPFRHLSFFAYVCNAAACVRVCKTEREREREKERKRQEEREREKAIERDREASLLLLLLTDVVAYMAAS